MLIGRKLGKYTVTDLLGQGGMATVYKGYQEDIDRYVAIKVLPPHPGLDQQFVERFRLEARTIARLQHPHILPLYDYGSEEDVFYLVMAYIEGGSLSDKIEEEGRISPVETDQLLRQMASALDYAHRQGVIHRDIKPGNILLDSEGHALLADFGIVKLTDTGSNLTGTGVVGTPAYMAPEQAQGFPIDARADLYSLGIVVYEMLTGKQPFTADTVMQILMKQISAPPPDITEQVTELPSGMSDVMHRVLAKDPADRYQTVAEFAEDFSRVTKGLETASGVRFVRGAETQFTDPPKVLATLAGQPTSTTSPAVAEAQSRQRQLIIGIGVLALIMLGIVGFIISNSNNNNNGGVTTSNDSTSVAAVPTPTPFTSFGRLTFITTERLADTVSLSVQNLDPAGAGRQYAAWLINLTESTYLPLGAITLDALGSGSLTFTDPEGRTLPAIYSGVLITAEETIGDAPAGTVLYSASKPIEVVQALNEIFVFSENGIPPAAVNSAFDSEYVTVTASDQGLLSGALTEGEIAEQHSGLAAQATNLGGLQLHAEHTINILRGTLDDFNGNGRGENPGRRIGVYFFIDLMEATLDTAANAPGADIRLQGDIELIRVCLINARGWADEMVALETELLTAPDVESVAPQAVQSSIAAGQIMRGLDLNANGLVEPVEGECGLEQVREFGILIGSMEIAQGDLPPGESTD